MTGALNIECQDIGADVFGKNVGDGGARKVRFHDHFKLPKGLIKTGAAGALKRAKRAIDPRYNCGNGDLLGRGRKAVAATSTAFAFEEACLSQ